jgi:hypothetical protein
MGRASKDGDVLKLVDPTMSAARKFGHSHGTTSVANDPSRRFATANYRIAKGSFALDVGCLTQATFAERPCSRILQGFPEIKTDRLNCDLHSCLNRQG